MKNLMETKKQKISSEQISKLEFFLGQEMQHIANQFAEFEKDKLTKHDSLTFDFDSI